MLPRVLQHYTSYFIANFLFHCPLLPQWTLAYSKKRLCQTFTRLSPVLVISPEFTTKHSNDNGLCTPFHVAFKMEFNKDVSTQCLNIHQLPVILWTSVDGCNIPKWICYTTLSKVNTDYPQRTTTVITFSRGTNTHTHTHTQISFSLQFTGMFGTHYLILIGSLPLYTHETCAVPF